MASENTVEAKQAPGKSILEKTKLEHVHTNQLFNISLNIAVTGEAGTGKSAFIYELLSLGDEGAAETGVTETITEPTPYKHPRMPNVTLWELPGVGSPNFPAKTYLKKVPLDKYDFFIIISTERFKENDIMLVKEIHKRKKPFYYIRSKIENDIRAQEGKRSVNREETLEKIRRNCEENLKNFHNPKVFLISSKDLSSYDFEKLVSTLMSELPEHKQMALLQSFPLSSVAMLETKICMFEKAAWAAAFLSGGAAALRVLGLSSACNTTILLAFFITCYYSFGLNDESLQRLSERVNKPHLKSLVKLQHVLTLVSNSAVRLQLSTLAGVLVVKYMSSLGPVIKKSATAVMYFGFTYKHLQNVLKKLSDLAQIVLTEAGLP